MTFEERYEKFGSERTVLRIPVEENNRMFMEQQRMFQQHIMGF